VAARADSNPPPPNGGSDSPQEACLWVPNRMMISMMRRENALLRSKRSRKSARESFMRGSRRKMTRKGKGSKRQSKN